MFKKKRRIVAPILSLSVALPLTIGIASAVDDDSNANIVNTEVVATESVKFDTRIVEDELIPKGVKVVTAEGSVGKKETVKITEDGGLFRKDTSYEKTYLAKAPSERVVRVGTNTDTKVEGVAESVAKKESVKIAEIKAKEQAEKEKAARELAEKEEKEKAERRAHLEQAAIDGSGVDIAFEDIIGKIDITAQGVTSPEENREFLRSITSEREFQCADKLVMKESGYVTTATNPSSGAYGVAQSLPAEKYASQGSDWQTNGKTQILWMKGYVDERYGGWCNALDFHHGNNWY